GGGEGGDVHLAQGRGAAAQGGQCQHGGETRHQQVLAAAPGCLALAKDERQQQQALPAIDYSGEEDAPFEVVRQRGGHPKAQGNGKPQHQPRWPPLVKLVQALAENCQGRGEQKIGSDHGANIGGLVPQAEQQVGEGVAGNGQGPQRHPVAAAAKGDKGQRQRQYRAGGGQSQKQGGDMDIHGAILTGSGKTGQENYGAPPITVVAAAFLGAETPGWQGMIRFSLAQKWAI